MKVMTIGDTHIWTYPKFGLNSNGYPRRLNDIEKGLNKISEIIRHEGVEWVVFLGDVFEHRDHVDTLSLCVFLRFIQSLPKECKVFVLKGNHDSFSKFEGESWIHYFPEITPMSYITEDTWNLEHRFEDFYLFGIPYSDSVETVQKNIDNIVSRIDELDIQKSLTVAHIGISEVASLYGYQDSKTFPQKELSKIRGYIRLGHYHDRTELDKNMMYVGTPWQTTFGELNQARGVDIYDTEIDKWSFYQIDIPSLITCDAEDFETRKATYPDGYFRVVGSPDEVSDESIISFKIDLANDQEISLDKDKDDFQITKDYIDGLEGVDEKIRKGMLLKAKEIIGQ